MIILKIFSSALGLIQLSLILCLFARYIYLEKGFSSSKKRQLFWGITIFVSFFYGILEKVFGITDGFLLLTVIFLFFVYIFLTRETRRIRGIFLLFPILGFVFSIF